MIDISQGRRSAGRRWPAEPMETPQPRPALFERVSSHHVDATSQPHGGKRPIIRTQRQMTFLYRWSCCRNYNIKCGNQGLPSGHLFFITKPNSVIPLLPTCLKFVRSKLTNGSFSRFLHTIPNRLPFLWWICSCRIGLPSTLQINIS
jgi:hypothetical protein